MASLFINHCFVIFIICFMFKQVICATLESSKAAEKSNNGSGRSETEESHHIIVYPTDSTQDLENRVGMQSYNYEPSPCPNDESFCETADDYPLEVIKKKMRKQPKLLLDLLIEEEEPDVTNKFGGDEITLCPSSTKTVYPKKGKSKEGFLEFIVNDDQHKQGIRVEACTNDGGECTIPGSLPLGYTSRCVQKHILRTLVVFNQTSSVEGFVTKPFEFPSCCACKITMSVEGYNRFGVEIEDRPVIEGGVQGGKHNRTMTDIKIN